MDHVCRCGISCTWLGLNSFFFLFFFPFFFFLPRVHCRFLFSFSPLWAFWCTFLCYHLDVLGYLSYILKDFPTLSHYWPGVRISALLSLDLSFAFCTAFVSSLDSHHCPCFYPVFAFFLLCYYIIIVIVFLISVISSLRSSDSTTG